MHIGSIHWQTNAHKGQCELGSGLDWMAQSERALTGIPRVRLLVCLLFYVLATSKSISGWVPTCDNEHSFSLAGKENLVLFSDTSGAH